MELRMTDKEMLELASEAAAYEIKWDAQGAFFVIPGICGGDEYWNPKDDDGDSRRLQVSLGIAVTPYPLYSEKKHSVIAKQYRRGDTMRETNPTEVVEAYGDDPEAATRLAVLRCAAKIAEAKRQQEGKS